MNKPEKNTVTVMLPYGYLSQELMKTVYDLAKKYNLKVFLSSTQNLRLTGMKDEEIEPIKEALAPLDVTFKGPGHFPKPRTCVGKTYCEMGLNDTYSMSDRILDHFKDRTFTKSKVKIAISGCPRCCTNAKLADIGLVATAKGGYDVYAGGKGGMAPVVGVRIAKNKSEEEVVEMIETIINFHDAKTDKKQRLVKLLDDPDFPYPPL